MAKTRVTITTKKGKAGAKGKKAAPQKKKFDLGDLPEEIAEQAREIWLAGLGALSVMEEEGAKTFKKLVAKGEAWEQEGRKQVNTAKSAAKARVAEAAEDLDDFRDSAKKEIGETVSSVQKTVEKMLGKFAQSMTTEVEELRERVETLAGQVRTAAQEGVDKAAKSTRKAAKKAGAKASNVYEVVPHKEGWAVQAAGAKQATRVLKTKKEAVAFAREHAQQRTPSQLVVYRQDGSVQDTFTYEAA